MSASLAAGLLCLRENATTGHRLCRPPLPKRCFQSLAMVSSKACQFSEARHGVHRGDWKRSHRYIEPERPGQTPVVPFAPSAWLLATARHLPRAAASAKSRSRLPRTCCRLYVHFQRGGRGFAYKLWTQSTLYTYPSWLRYDLLCFHRHDERPRDRLERHLNSLHSLRGRVAPVP